uniref:toll-like receptor 12 n=1 Tax=Euleptes europaea TaxID=460621 RepID=UPI0025420A7A|nr:toll-like receptor 12 [Euleptes europaea]
MGTATSCVPKCPNLREVLQSQAKAEKALGLVEDSQTFFGPGTTNATSVMEAYTGLVVLCSNITSLPGDLAPLPEQVNALCLSGSIDALYEGAFLPFPELRYLSITVNVSVISPRAFLGLDKLQHLSIHHSDVGCSNISIPTEVFQPLHQLQMLDMKGIHLTGQREVVLPSQLQSLSVSSWSLQHFSELFSIFPSLRSVPQVTVNNCEMERMSCTLSSKQHRNHPILAVSPSGPQEVRMNPEAPNGRLLQSLSLSQLCLAFSELLALEIEELDSLSLEEINLPNGSQACSICVLAARFSLHSLIFSWNYHTSFSGEELSGCHSLKNLVLEGNKLEHLDSLLLSKLPQLLSLDLSENRLHWDLCPAAYKTMNFTASLQVLDFSGNNGTTLPDSAFSCLPYLQELSFNRCGLKKIDPLAFSGFNNLKVLNLKENHHYSPKEVQYYFTDLPSLEVLKVVNSNIRYISAVFFLGKSNLRSLVLEKEDFLALNSDIQDQIEEHGHPRYLHFSNVTFRYFLFLVYMLRAWWKGLLGHNKDRRFEYDAFVSYSSQDQEWVLKHLVPNLEQNGPPFLKLCLHNRDFVVGKAIVDNIMESLYSSRKTICLISHNALGSHWCSLEMSLATYRLVAEQEDTLILLFMEPIPRKQLSAYHRLAKLVKRKTYLDWPKELAAQEAFWDKLRDILGQHKANGHEKM